MLAKHRVDFVIVGGVAATIHGSSYLTYDLDICYARTPSNLERLVQALCSVNVRLRGAPEGLPFILDAETLRRGLNFTFVTDVGPVDLLGEVAGVGIFEQIIASTEQFEMFGHRYAVLSLAQLIAAKRAAGRAKDLLVLPELEAIYEFQRGAVPAMKTAQPKADIADERG